jgi:DNA-binding transcriptional MerR regulator
MANNPPNTRRTAMTVRQVARVTGLTGWTLRYYEKIGLIDPVPRDASSGHRMYDPVAVERIESLANLRAAGLAIEEMRVLMHSRGHAPETIETKLRLLQEHRAKLAADIAQLRARMTYLDNRIAYWQAVQGDDSDMLAQLTARGQALSRRLG